MGFLTKLLRPTAATRDAAMWTPSAIGSKAYSGVTVTPETSLMASPVWACTRLIAESIAAMPTIMYRRLADGGKERDPNHPLYALLHDSPNDLQTAFAWKRVMMVHALLYGGGYSRILPGVRGPVDRLEPIHPNNIRIEGLPSGGIRYQIRGDDGIESPVNAEDIFHLPGLSLDGVSGLSLVEYARESIGLELAAKGYSAKFFGQNARPGGVLQHPGKLSPEAAKNMRESWEEAHAGVANAHRVAVLEEGTEWKQTGMTHQDAELIAQLDWASADIARFFNVPLHMIQLMTKTTSWGSGIEEMGIEFVVFSLLPWIKNWEQLIAKNLILAPERYFAEFLVDSLMRGKQSDRYSAYATGRNWGWLSANDVRKLENMNPVEGGDAYLRPLNMVDANEPELPPMHRPPTPAQQTEGHYQLLLHEAASRVIRKEIMAMGKAAKRTADDADAWQAAVAEFYDTHGAYVAEALRIGRDDADQYAAEQAEALVTHGATIMADWETVRAGDLIALAMGGQNGQI